MRLARLLLAAPLALAACGDDKIVTMTEPTGRPSAAMSDFTNGGTTGFFFLAPVVDQPKSSQFGTFDGGRTVTVTICTLNRPVPGEIPTCGSAETPLPAVVLGVDVHGHHYHTNWRTEYFVPGAYYRLTVREGLGTSGAAFGFVDVFLGATGRDFRDINKAEFAPLLDGRTLPIKFRIEKGAQPGQGGNGGGLSHCDLNRDDPNCAPT